MKHSDLKHLFWRIGFGASPEDFRLFIGLNRKTIVNMLIEDSMHVIPLKIDTPELESILNSGDKLSPENRKKVQELSRKKTMELNTAWIERLVNSKGILREKMTLFWANIFVCEDNNTVYIQKFNNTLRQHALGNFGDFAKAISKEAAMTKYLNTKQNRKQKPNENFARELMELFMLGEGYYTEKDIKESARAFTGYGHNLKGDFVLRNYQHDNNDKTFFGRTGNFNGDDIIDIILEQRQCARFICEKVYRYFVNDIINETYLDEMVNVFYKDYNIEKLMRYILLSDWFYNNENVGSKIKSPVEFLVGLQRVVPVEFYNKRELIFIQKQLGQILLNPPNVAGWKGGKSWIDSNTIVLRLKLPSLILNNAFISKFQEDEVVEERAQMMKRQFKNRLGKRFKTQADWEGFENCYKDILIDNLTDYILCCDIKKETYQYLQHLDKVSKKEYCIQLMSLPEYQMC